MDFKFAKEVEKTDKTFTNNWKLLIADDEEDIHSVTKLALKKFVFEERGIEFFDAYSGNETIEILKENHDIDLVLLDVVMDSDDDGLESVKRIREELGNTNVRIILRTGQPGSAPQKEVILNYDIDDYKEKTELTSVKLFSTVVTAFRTSKHLKDIEKNRLGLSKIIDASKYIFKLSSLSEFTKGVLLQLDSILNIDKISSFTTNGFFATLKNKKYEILSTSGRFDSKGENEILTPYVLERIDKAFFNDKSFVDDDTYIGYFKCDNEHILFLYLEGCRGLSEDDKRFLEVFLQNTSISYDNICLVDRDKQKDVILYQQAKMAAMGEMIENIAHQWKQPLSVISVSAEELELRKELNNLSDEIFHEDCANIIQGVQHLSQTINDFRDFFKPDKERCYFKITSVIDKALQLLSSKLKSKSVTVVKQSCDVEIYGIKNELIQSFINILNNAIDALIEIKDDERFIFIGYKIDDPKILSIDIKDSGPGIKEDIIDNIFDQYFTTKGEIDGTGIGLYMVKQMIERHMGGRIEAVNTTFEYDDKIYSGACFTVRLKIGDGS